jgi:two-component system, sensor histidine kinase PdtaS
MTALSRVIVERNLAIALGAETDPVRAARLVLRTASAIEGVDGGFVFLHGTGRPFGIVASEGLSNRLETTLSALPNDITSARAAFGCEPTKRRFGKLKPIDRVAEAEGFRAVFAFPFVRAGMNAGMLGLLSRTRTGLPQGTRRSLEAISRIGGMGIRMAADRARVDTELEEKDIFLREAYHRIKNGLQLLCNLLLMEAGNAGDAETANLIIQTERRIASVGLAYDLVANEAPRGRISAADYLRALAAATMDSLEREHGSPEMEILIDPGILLVAETAIPLGLLVNELITNTLKHAVNPTGKGRIALSLSQDEASMLLRYRDSGKDKGWEVAEQGTSFGGTLIDFIVRKLTASIERSSGNGGLGYSIRIPLEPSEGRFSRRNRYRQAGLFQSGDDSAEPA